MTLKLWQDATQVEQSLSGPGPFFLASIDNPHTGGGVAGRICDVMGRHHASRLIANHTHRLATPEEIKQFHETLKRQTEQLAALAHANKQQFALPDDLKALVQTAALIIERESANQTKTTHSKEKS